MRISAYSPGGLEHRHNRHTTSPHGRRRIRYLQAAVVAVVAGGLVSCSAGGSRRPPAPAASQAPSAEGGAENSRRVGLLHAYRGKLGSLTEDQFLGDGWRFVGGGQVGLIGLMWKPNVGRDVFMLGMSSVNASTAAQLQNNFEMGRTLRSQAPTDLSLGASGRTYCALVFDKNVLTKADCDGLPSHQ